MRSDVITVGIVGLGRAGWNIHATALRPRSDFQIVGAVDPCEERRQEASRVLGCQVFPDLDAMLKSVCPEVVVVATPNANHEQDCLVVLAAGLSCVLEKPIAPDWAGACRILAAADRSAGKLFVYHQHLFLRDFRFLNTVCDSNELGEIFELRLNWARYTRRNDWQTLRKNGGGLLRNYASHALSIVLPLLGGPVCRLSSMLRQVKDPGDCEDHVHLFLEAKNGRVADVFISTACAIPLPRFALLGSLGSVVSLDDKRARIRFIGPHDIPELHSNDGAAEGRKYVVSEELPWRDEERPIEACDVGYTFYDNVADVLRRGGKMVVTPESALEVARVLEWAATGKNPFREMRSDLSEVPLDNLIGLGG